jgi:hypothetical protein
MPDKRTGSKITWFNSPLRVKQDVSTLVNMIQVGQWYGVHKVRVKVINNTVMSLCSLLSVLSQKGGPKEKCRPTVSFRDVEKDLRPQSSKLSGSAPLQPHDINNSDDSDESDVDRSHSFVPQENAIRVDDDVDLASGFLKNMFVATDPSAAAKAPQCDPAPERSFVDDSKAVDWDF